jgi:hypothetical protein
MILRINRDLLSVVMVMVCVFFEVQTECLNIIETSFGFQELGRT